MRAGCRSVARRGLYGGVAPYILSAAAAGARAGSRVEGRCRGGAGAIAAERTASTAGRRRGEPLQLGLAGLLDGKFVGEQLGERESAGGPVVLAQQVAPFGGGEGACGDRI